MPAPPDGVSTSVAPEGAPTLIVAALPEELAPFRKRATRERFEGGEVLRTAAGETPLVLAVTGDGPAKANRVAARLVDRYRPAALVGVGVAGALTAGLAPFDLVASARLRNGTGEAPAPDAEFLRRATAAGAVPATLVTVDRPILSAAAKQALAPPGAENAAVDMESAAWAKAASAAGVPFVVVRAIADGAHEDLPAYLADCVGPDGGVRRSAVVARALANPGSLPALWRIRKRLAACAARLATFLLDGYFGT